MAQSFLVSESKEWVCIRSFVSSTFETFMLAGLILSFPGRRQSGIPGQNTGVCEIKAVGPYEFKGFGAIDGNKPYKLIWFGDIDAPKPYEFIGSGGFCL